MAASATPADQTSDLMQKLSLDSRTKRDDAPEATKKASSGVQNGPKVAGWQTTSSERSATPVVPGFVDPSMCYANGHATPAYYYGVNEWEEYPRYLSPGIEMSPHSQGIYGDMYHGYACAAYGAYPPGSGVPTIGHDGHLYELYPPQHYQYPEAYYQSNAPAYPTNASTKPPQSGGAAISTATENPSLPVEKVKAISDTIVKVNAGSLSSKPVQKGSAPKDSQNRGSVPGVVPHNYHDQRFGYNGLYSPSPWLDASVMSENYFPTASSNIPQGRTSRNQNAQLPLFMGSHPLGAASGMGLANAGYPRSYMNSQFYGQYGNALRNGQSFGSSGSNANGRNWLTMDGKYNVRGRGIGFYGYGNENVEVLNELNRGPRSGRKNGQKDMGPDAVKGQNLASVTNNEEANGLPNGDLYNKNDFPDNYPDAKFFVIKSYSEDDIHKSIKYGVWASTPNGNKKLDDAYKEAEAKSNQCPIFLFFSVNTSGQFVGVAEMMGAVDFNKTVEYWQQDKWNGCFSVKWHIVKDVPNSTLKHIILENNENKPVTNSRDTQEVKLEQGNQMLKLFKEHVSKTSVLDDFGFYETRQKIMQARRVKQQFQKQVWDGKAAPTLANISISDVVNVKQKLWEPAVAQEIAS